MAGNRKPPTPAGRDDDKSGYPERQPRDKQDARRLGKRPRRDPDEGGVDRESDDNADIADDG